ncbi:BAG family molecular chaperone regulator 2, partial [Trichinella pseudospiralis]
LLMMEKNNARKYHKGDDSNGSEESDIRSDISEENYSHDDIGSDNERASADDDQHSDEVAEENEHSDDGDDDDDDDDDTDDDDVDDISPQPSRRRSGRQTKNSTSTDKKGVRTKRVAAARVSSYAEEADLQNLSTDEDSDVEAYGRKKKSNAYDDDDWTGEDSDSDFEMEMKKGKPGKSGTKRGGAVKRGVGRPKRATARRGSASKRAGVNDSDEGLSNDSDKYIPRPSKRRQVASESSENASCSPDDVPDSQKATPLTSKAMKKLNFSGWIWWLFSGGYQFTQLGYPNQMSTSRERNVPINIMRKSSVEEISDRIVNLLDEIEKRVESLRETATVMEQEKENIIEMLSTVQMNKDLLKLNQGEKDDIEATANRLINRCRAVQVSVATIRNSEQAKALEIVNEKIEELLKKMQEDINTSRQTCQTYLNACNPDSPTGPIDQKFQANLIECTADDQKKIRRRLEQLLNLIERSVRTIDQASL